jgi:hypothetical protein
MHATQLAHGKITNADTLTVELVEPTDMPPVIRLRWPEKPSLCPPCSYDNVAAAAMQVLTAAVIELAAVRVWRKL